VDPFDRARVAVAGGAQQVLGLVAELVEVGLATYPGVFVLPKGAAGAMIAMAETNRGWLFDYEPGKRATPLGRAGRWFPMEISSSRSYPTYGSMVLLPIEPNEPRMRILAVGGSANEDLRCLNPSQESTKVVEIFEVNTAKSVQDNAHGWRRPNNGAELAKSRILCDATLLADGTVLVSGGSRTGWGDLNREAVLDAELFDPKDETIRLAARASTDRRYHSTALLQLDGTVLKAGSSGGFGNVSKDDEGDEAHRTEADTGQGNDSCGGNAATPDNGVIPDDGGTPWMTVHTTAERYWPPYLFAGPRPTILNSPGSGDGTKLEYNTEIVLTVIGAGMDDEARAALIRLGSVTHGNDMDQRYVWLDTNTRKLATKQWEMTSKIPANSATAPPGDYQLVVVDRHGVPSPGRLVRLVR
jgi:hypothetical protein